MAGTQRVIMQHLRNMLTGQIVSRCEQRSGYHLMTTALVSRTTTTRLGLLPTAFLPTVVPSCTIKVKAYLKRRCKDCYSLVKGGRSYIFCKTHKRHNCASIVPSIKVTAIMTSATGRNWRPW